VKEPRENGRRAFRSLTPALDAVNRRILLELIARPRLGMSELARRVGMSAPAVTERVQRLEEGGVIAGCRLELDPAALGLPISAFVRIRPAPGQLRRVAEVADASPEIVECHRVTGEDCFIARVHVTSMGNLEQVLDRFLAHGQTTSSIVQSSPVPPRPLPLPES
jgi:Lrp/AsnC family transcriptional regulator, leucine-responsive regulatory protein